MTGPDLLRECIDVSGLSSTRFAHEILAGRHPRTIRRWLDGETMPDRVAEWLADWLLAALAEAK